MKVGDKLICKNEIPFGPDINNILPGNICKIDEINIDSEGVVFYNIIHKNIPTYFNIYDYLFGIYFYTKEELRLKKLESL